MKIYDSLINGNEKYGITKADICKAVLNCNKEKIKETVIIAPWWDPNYYKNVSYEQMAEGSIKVWDFYIGDKECTYIKTGIGASVCTDAILALGCTQCKKIIFVGSVGALHKNINIGDIVIPKSSVCGDGVCRYLELDLNNDCFGQRYFPDKKLYEDEINITDEICQKNEVKWHVVNNFSVDTIFAQFAHLDTIIGMNCSTIEMETAAAFKAANICNIPMCAIFSTSDNSILKKSLYSGRTEKDQTYRKYVRSTIIPEIIYHLI
ncbi:MAG: phosphorylase family protein [Clostridiaceae bacterium]|jgi:purine-nucleoside phosphorylase|nr:phosphorylase family protein [Clostridiaceae bacterium]